VGTSLHKTFDKIEDVHLRGIGLVSLSWSYLEGAAERIIWRLSRLDDRTGPAITTHMGYGQRLQAAETLLHNEFPGSSEYASFKTLAEHIRKNLSAKRNEIVHSRLVGLEHADIRVIYKARGKLIKDVKPIEPREYDDVHNEIIAAADQLREILAGVLRLVQEKDGRD
jgi:hypothetical protein